MALPGELPTGPRFEPSGDDVRLPTKPALPRFPRPRGSAPSKPPAAPPPASPPAAAPPAVTPPAPSAAPPAPIPHEDVPFVLERYVRSTPTPLDPYIEKLDPYIEQAEVAAGETLAYVQENKRKTAAIALGILVVGMFLTSINRRRRTIFLGSTDLT